MVNLHTVNPLTVSPLMVNPLMVSQAMVNQTMDIQIMATATLRLPRRSTRSIRVVVPNGSTVVGLAIVEEEEMEEEEVVVVVMVVVVAAEEAEEMVEEEEAAKSLLHEYTVIIRPHDIYSPNERRTIIPEGTHVRHTNSLRTRLPNFITLFDCTYRQDQTEPVVISSRTAS
jgi:hypothetical protein